MWGRFEPRKYLSGSFLIVVVGGGFEPNLWFPPIKKSTESVKSCGVHCGFSSGCLPQGKRVILIHEKVRFFRTASLNDRMRIEPIVEGRCSGSRGSDDSSIEHSYQASGK
jgi:hypothetical protein